MQNRERERVEYGLIDTAACASTKIVMGAAEDSTSANDTARHTVDK